MDIRGKHVRLRAVAEDDLPQLLVWANDPGIWDLLEGCTSRTRASRSGAGTTPSRGTC